MAEDLLLNVGHREAVPLCPREGVNARLAAGEAWLPAELPADWHSPSHVAGHGGSPDTDS